MVFITTIEQLAKLLTIGYNVATTEFFLAWYVDISTRFY